MAVQDVYRALSDPGRRRILKLLQDGPLPAGAIAAELPMTWPSVSRHLALLANAGLVRHERKGQHVIYELSTTVLLDIVPELAELARIGGGTPDGEPPERAS